MKLLAKQQRERNPLEKKSQKRCFHDYFLDCLGDTEAADEVTAGVLCPVGHFLQGIEATEALHLPGYSHNVRNTGSMRFHQEISIS